MVFRTIQFAIHYWAGPLRDAFLSRNIPFHFRLRLLAFQVALPLVYSLTYVPWIFSRRYSVHYLPTRSGRKVRAIVFRPPRRDDLPGLRPLHFDTHGGGFLGGLPESDAKWLAKLSDETGAVCVSTMYRYSPRFPFPGAIDDVDDVLAWLIKHGEDRFGADPTLLTTSGFSAGGNLAIATSLQEQCRPPSKTNVKASVTFYAAIDLRLEPQQKPVPENFPKHDPAAVVLPLFNSYAGLAGPENKTNPRLHPFLAPIEWLPRDMLLVVPEIDILVHEQTEFVMRVQREVKEAEDSGKGEHRRIEMKYMKGGFHGWLELPKGVINEKDRIDAFNAGVDFIKAVHVEHGFKW